MIPGSWKRWNIREECGQGSYQSSAYGGTNLSIVACVGGCWGQADEVKGLRALRKGE
jgi:hypothetical protein